MKHSSIAKGIALLLIVATPLSAQRDKPPVPAGYTEVPPPKSVENHPIATRDILKLDGPSVLEIEVHNNSGAASAQASGVVVAPNGVVATNAHVLTGACNLYIKEQSGSLVAASTLLNIDADKDIAILLFPKSFPVAKLGDSQVLQVGDRVITIGNPLGLEQTVSEGIVSGFRTMEGKRAVIQTTAPIFPGSSGGGLFNSKGELVGLTTFTLKESQNLNFAVPLADVIGLLRSGAQQVTPENLLLWAKVTYPNCSGSPSSLDSMVIAQQLLGHQISDPNVLETLRQLNGGTKPPSPKVWASRDGEFRVYALYDAGVEVVFVEGLCKAVEFHSSFGGILPMGLSWKMSQLEIKYLIGKPTNSATGSEDTIDNYDAYPTYGYDIVYTLNGRLDGISVSLAGPRRFGLGIAP